MANVILFCGLDSCLSQKDLDFLNALEIRIPSRGTLRLIVLLSRSEYIFDLLQARCSLRPRHYADWLRICSDVQRCGVTNGGVFIDCETHQPSKIVQLQITSQQHIGFI